jgi:predicted YcjX-like family ATPase
MIAGADHDARFQGVTTDMLTTCAIQSAHSVEREHQGRTLRCVRGVPRGQQQEIDVFPGEIPEHIPSPREWMEGRFDFPDFNPPQLYDVKGQGIPHVRLDQALEFLIGDRLA